MKICVIGAGAIGGLLGARLALAGHELTFIVRGAHLQALARDGLRLVEHDGTEQVVRAVRACEHTAEAGVHDAVVLAMKAHQVGAVVPTLAPLLGPHSVLVPMQNGVPFWYFHQHGGPLAGTVVRSVDPDGAIARGVPLGQVLGCVVYPASELLAPGVVRHIEGDRFPLGELHGRSTARAAALSQAFADAGFKAPVLEDIRAELWLKLWGNLCFNPISALGHATLEGICRFPPSRELAAQMMREAQAVAGRLGIAFRVSLDKRIAGAERVGAHKTSMLQDVEAGRAPEADALVGAVAELGRLTGVPTPHINAVYALMQLLAHSMAQQPGRLRLQPLA